MNTTQLFIIITTAIIIIYDIVIYIAKGVDWTISRAVLAWSRKYPILPFAVGVLCGHLFWAQP